MYQMDGETLSFNANPDKAYSKLFTELKSGTPMVIGINGNHAINAVRLIQDLEDANKFKLEVYDKAMIKHTNFKKFNGEVKDIEESSDIQRILTPTMYVYPSLTKEFGLDILPF